MNTKKGFIGLVLVGVALQCAALTIGPTRGAAWIGRPLELIVPVLRDPLSEGTPLCADADVFYADSQQDPSQVQVQQELTEQPDTVRLRLRSSGVVNEPVITVTLRVGCEQKFQRRFVLLADLPLVSELSTDRTPTEVPEPLVTPTTEPASAAAPPPPLPAPTTGTSLNNAESNLPALSSQRSGAAAPSPTPKRQTGVRQSAPKMAVAKAKPTPSISADKPHRTAGSRLQLDPLEILVQRVKTLEIATAAAPAEVVNKEAELLLRMESDLKSLREQAAKSEATLSALQKRLEQDESHRVSAELFYGLLAVVVVCAAAIVALLQRRRMPPVVGEGPDKMEPEPYEAQFLRKTLDEQKFESAPVARKPSPLLEPDEIAFPVDVDLVEFEKPPEPDPRIAATRRL